METYLDPWNSIAGVEYLWGSLLSLGIYPHQPWPGEPRSSTLKPSDLPHVRSSLLHDYKINDQAYEN